jgi:hypothetical protein
MIRIREGLTIVVSRVAQYAEFGIHSDAAQGHGNNRTNNTCDDDAIGDGFAGRTR